nr:unnamed protein product [Callosobruchus chinensis]
MMRAVEERVQIPRCYRCEEFGHRRNECKGPDRDDKCLSLRVYLGNLARVDSSSPLCWSQAQEKREGWKPHFCKTTHTQNPQRNTTHRHQPRNSDLFEFFRGRTPGLIAWAVAMNKPVALLNFLLKCDFVEESVVAMSFSSMIVLEEGEIVEVRGLAKAELLNSRTAFLEPKGADTKETLVNASIEASTVNSPLSLESKIPLRGCSAAADIDNDIQMRFPGAHSRGLTARPPWLSEKTCVRMDCASYKKYVIHKSLYLKVFKDIIDYYNTLKEITYLY